jgi:ferrous iron transport protein B
MATRGIKDEKARMATMLVVPLMNCMAKIPFYTLLVGMFFAAHKGPVMFMIATITIIVALSVSKVLSLTMLKRKETAPFVLEMPPYHLPTVQNVTRRMVERVWLFVKKIVTVVVVVMFVIYLLISFPGLNPERKAYYEAQTQGLIQSLSADMGAGNSYTMLLDTPEELAEYGAYLDSYRAEKRDAKMEAAKEAVDQKFLERNPEFFKIANKGRVPLAGDELASFAEYLSRYEKAKAQYLALYWATEPSSREGLKRTFYQSWQDVNPKFFGIVRTGRIVIRGDEVVDEDAEKVARAYRDLDRGRQVLRMARHDEVMEMSFLGRLGVALEPITQYAGFNWRVNIGLISSFAAKEGVVATLGSIYQSPPGGEEAALEERLAEKEKGWTPLHAVAMILFMALYPPCIPTLLMIKLQAGWKWMLFATVYPIILGFILAVLAFSGGNLLGLGGLSAMTAVYCLVVVITVVMGLIKSKPESA